jgi:aminoglycoside phosphotransferase (APT) family kinase protein
MIDRRPPSQPGDVGSAGRQAGGMAKRQPGQADQPRALGRLVGNYGLEDTQTDATKVAAIIHPQFPEICLSNVKLLGEGCDSWAFEVSQRWVFRFPKRADVDEQLLVEFRIVPVLATQSPLPLPTFCFLGQPSAVFPFHFAGYPKLPGVPAIQVDPQLMPFERWAPTMGRFLSWLHRFPASEARRLGVQHQNVAELIQEVRADALDDFDVLRQVACSAPVERWKEFFVNGPQPLISPRLTPVIAHRDLAAEHVLCDLTARAITGIIDWTEIAVTDRCVDFAGAFHWGGEPCMDAVLSHYDGAVDEGVLHRARFLAACRGVADVAFGLETGRREYIQAGIRALGFCLG